MRIKLLFIVLIINSYISYAQDLALLKETNFTHDTLRVIIQENPQETEDLIDIADPACFEVCCYAPDEFFMFFTGAWELFFVTNLDYIEKKTEEGVAYIQHIDFGLRYATPTPIYTPYIRGQVGFLSTRFRIMYHEPQFDFLKEAEYTTYDWQILGAHLVNMHKVSFGISSGVMWQDYDGIVEPFHEHTAVLEVYPMPKLSIRGEGRIAHGATHYKNGSLEVRREFNGTASYELNSDENVHINFLVGGMYAQ